MTHRILAVLALVIANAAFLSAQFYGDKQPDKLQNTSTILRPPKGAKVAIIEFDDLECPPCARAFPVIHRVIQQYRVPLIRYDYPLKSHIWSFEASVIARWMQDREGGVIADEYRGEIFASQSSILGKDDLERVTREFAVRHRLELPSPLDPDHSLTNEVVADRAVGEKLNINGTPTVVVVTDAEYQIVSGNWPANKTEIDDLSSVVGAAMARAGKSARSASDTLH
jgi:protein-disulfide isomerase